MEPQDLQGLKARLARLALKDSPGLRVLLDQQVLRVLLVSLESQVRRVLKEQLEGL
jgi:hypothetical protein